MSIEFAITKRGKVGGMKLVANVKVTENVIEFETHDKNVTFYWSLTVQKSRTRGLLHGSCREMLIDDACGSSTDISMSAMAMLRQLLNEKEWTALLMAQRAPLSHSWSHSHSSSFPKSYSQTPRTFAQSSVR